MVCHLSDRIVPGYCHHLLRTPGFVAQMTRMLRGLGDVEQGNARTPRINPGDFLRCVVPLPRVEEQQRILRAVEEQLAVMESVTEDARRAVELSRERRTALITAAVSGQIDVTREGATHG
jgi:type I restriction enzyme S subunit